MDLKTLVAKYPFLYLAELKDQSRLLNYFNQRGMSGKGLSLRVTRDPDYCRLLHSESKDFATFFGQDDAGNIMGMGTFTFRKAYLRGEIVGTGFLRDLRISSNRNAVRLWRKFLGDLLKESPKLEETGFAQYYLTTIMDMNQRAQKALIDPIRQDFVYEKLIGFNTVSLLGRKPFYCPKHIKSHYRISRGSLINKEKLLSFLNNQNQKKIFGFVFDESELQRRFQSWGNLSWNSFYVAENPAGEILGCFAPWDPSFAKQTVIDTLPWAIHLLAKIKFLSRWIYLPSKEAILPSIYLSHLEIAANLPDSERAQILSDLLDAYLNDKPSARWTPISFCEFNTESILGTLPKKFFIQKEPLSIYVVRHKDTQRLDESLFNKPPGFEMALW